MVAALFPFAIQAACLVEDGSRSFQATGQERCDSAHTPSLREIAATNGRYFGSAVTSYHLRADPLFRALVAREAGVIVPETELKWAMVEPKQGQYDFSAAESLLVFAQTQRMQIRGHTLVWHNSLPSWFGTRVNRRNADSVLQSHVKTEVKQFGGRIRSWDVVNEAINPEDGRTDALRKSPWLELLGPRYIDVAFRTARAADPRAELVLNQNGLEHDVAWSAQRRSATLRLLHSLKQAGVPVDALGIEGHLWSHLPFSPIVFAAFLDSVYAVGLRVVITELDVRERTPHRNPVTRDSIVGALYEQFVRTSLRHPAVTGIITWGLTDKYSWVDQYFPRPDGLPSRPLPYDKRLCRKSVRDALARALGTRAQ